MITLRELNARWMRVGQVIGHYVSGFILTVFYFTIFALFAIPYRLVQFFSASRLTKTTAYRTGPETVTFDTEF
jgi:hypothetical protein